jgi:hypothetical protein
MKRTFKLAIVLLCLAAMAAMSSCSKEQSYKETIIGKWQLVDCKLFNSDGSAVDMTQDIEDVFANIAWTFNSDGTVTVTSNYGAGTVSWLIEGDKITFSSGVEYTIEKLTSTKMILKGKSGEYNATLYFDKVK